jgi:transposase
LARIARWLETVSPKLASVASNIVGKSGMAMLPLLASGVGGPEQLADEALGHLRPKMPELMLALDGKPDDHFRRLLVELLNKLDWLAEELRRLDAQIAASSGTYTDVLQRLAPISGVDGTTTLILVAEFDLDMTCFPTAGHLGELGGLLPRKCGERGQTLFRAHAKG